MKFWQIYSIKGVDSDLIQSVSRTNEKWKNISEWDRNFEKIVAVQDRSILDSVLPEKFILTLLNKLTSNLFLGNDYWLRTEKSKFNETEVSILDAYKLIGGDKLEEVFEYGSVFYDNNTKKI